MPSDSESRRHRREFPGEPIAIVGIAALYPGARGPDEFWTLLNDPPSGSVPPGPRLLGNAPPGTDFPGIGPPGTRPTGTDASPWGASQTAGGLGDIEVDVARFGIPPAQAASMTRMQLLMLEAARQCLEDAGHPARALPAERTDVITGTCLGLDRQHANALRVEGSRYAREVERAVVTVGADADSAARAARELRTFLLHRLGGSPHDRVGEMASTIPARIATAFKLRGRTFAVESADATSFLGIAHAVGNLRGGLSDAVLVLAGQRQEGPLLARALEAKGLLAPDNRPFTSEGRGFALGEGVGALLLKRLSSAVRDEDRIYATILDCTLRHDPRPGAFRYSTSAEHRRTTAAASFRAAGVPATSVQYVECVGSGVLRESHAELTALSALYEGAAPASVVLGSVKDRLGHTVANAGLAGVTKTALALHHRALPPQWAAAGEAAGSGDDGTAGRTGAVGTAGNVFRLLGSGEAWQPGPGGAPRRAAVLGASLTGTLCHLVLEEHPATGRGERRASASRGGSADRNHQFDPGVLRTRSQSGGPAVSAGPPPPVPVPGAGGAAQPIAVIGLGGWFAGSPDAGSFWRTTRSGRGCIGPVPDSVLDRDLYHAPGALSLTHSYTDQGGHVTVPEAPPGELRITPVRHAAMDAAQRLALAVASELLTVRAPATASRHHRPRPSPPHRTGARARLNGHGLVAVGSNLGLTRERRASTELCLPDLEEAVAGLAALDGLSPVQTKTLIARVRERWGPQEDRMSPALLDGCLASGTAALIVNEYGLDAVPVAVEAACASSLAALDVAVTALRSGTADFAVAGGVELACTARDMVLCSALGLLSHSRNAPFDAGADGFTPGDGCGLFLLKRYDDALRDGDGIVGLIRGIGASNDAKSLIAPDVEGQVRAMERAFAQVGFEPVEVDYLEAHGTGTRVGDRVEIAAAARVYADRLRTRPLEIGSAKSFFGHTFAAAGSAGLLRTLLAMRARTLPPNTNLHALNPALDLAAIPAAVSTAPSPWPTEPGRPRRAGISSFGTGGINYHLLVEEHMDGTR